MSCLLTSTPAFILINSDHALDEIVNLQEIALKKTPILLRLKSLNLADVFFEFRIEPLGECLLLRLMTQARVNDLAGLGPEQRLLFFLGLSFGGGLPFRFFFGGNGLLLFFAMGTGLFAFILVAEV